MIKNDEYYMREALKEASTAFLEGEVPVGAVIVYNEKIIARSYNQREKMKSALHHAEIIAISKATKKLKQKFLDGAVMYVTIEPCLMCAGAIYASRIKRIVYGAKEEKFGALTSVTKVYDAYKSNHHVEVLGGVLEEEASILMKEFFKILRAK